MSGKSALLVIDIQFDFLPEGSLAVKNGDDIIPGVLKLLDDSQYKWDAIAYSQDWHPKDHTSFAVNHSNTKPFENIEFTSTKDPTVKAFQTVWPPHCVQFCHGANFPEELVEAYKKIKVPKTIVQKGQLQDRDYYSAFNDVWNDNKTELEAFLRKNDIENVFVCGLAYDYCVKFTSVSSSKLGFKTFVIKPLSKAIDVENIDKTDDYYVKNNVVLVNDLNDPLLTSHAISQ